MLIGKNRKVVEMRHGSNGLRIFDSMLRSDKEDICNYGSDRHFLNKSTKPKPTVLSRNI